MDLDELLDKLTSAVGGGGSKPKKEDAPPDPFADITAANKQTRETAKWLLTTFAAVGAILVGGLQLSSLGELTGETPDTRIVAALLGVGVAALGVGLAIGYTGAVLLPFLNSFRTADEHPTVTTRVLGDREIVGKTYDELKVKIHEKDEAVETARAQGTSSAAYQEAKANRLAWEKSKQAALVNIGAELLRGRFIRARRATIAGVVLILAGVVAFAWGANPPDDEKEAEPVVLGQAPLLLDVALTKKGVQALKEKRGCQSLTVRALSIGGKEGQREVLTIPTSRCKTVRFVLTPTVGTATAAG